MYSKLIAMMVLATASLSASAEALRYDITIAGEAPVHVTLSPTGKAVVESQALAWHDEPAITVKLQALDAQGELLQLVIQRVFPELAKLCNGPDQCIEVPKRVTATYSELVKLLPAQKMVANTYRGSNSAEDLVTLLRVE